MRHGEAHSMGGVIRRASPDDRSGVVATVTAAFAEDPGWEFIFGEDYARLAGHFAEALFDARVARRSVWVSDDLAATAMWEPPDADEVALAHAELVWARYDAIAGERSSRRLALYHDAVAAVAPSEPHWYLGILATHPSRRREGLASAVITPVLEQADRAGVACCLETSTAENRRFYERRGFTQATDIDLPDGPATWWLRRPPQRG